MKLSDSERLRLLLSSLALVGVFAFIALSLWLSWSNWVECRSTPHSVLYCMRVLGDGK